MKPLESERTAFNSALVKMLPYLRGLASRLVSNPHDQEDLVQDTLAAALQRWRSYQPENNFAGWLTYQMRERRTAMLRAKGGEAASDAIEDYAAPATQDASVRLVDVVRAMRPQHRPIMAMLASGYEPIEIAAIEGVSRQAIHDRITACRRRLRRMAA
ncbi:RNA polymerase sigma factor [Mesorhizobium sp. M00.F.Ca.ET.217.01.1.1]|uniref:RNA polymerase sigma factor n=1 Tax=Mesorhizobium sp. M00.F.Ca.ET.217.01.1.1 TaxID=2500529 RepID=UPI000FD7BDDB|nr:sigma-70 family RNA polymerase sigma factor [Mesorhizobium sp. M00.F.Ca.ET.217.01.1.1]TGQ19280.1 sigma-70 family RNA polymerase sigma factor [Mesorhizobium sp. M00.F.Ca.ET.217.01.1.1]